MPLPAPNLDDRTYDQLVSAAIARIQASAPGWSDLTPGDPGVTLMEAFAYLADVTIYRLNQLPDKLYVEFLRLIGVAIQPPAAATVELVFSRDRDSDDPIEIPQGTRVTTKGPGSGAELPVFATLSPAVIAADASRIAVRAIHADAVEGELLGHSSGTPGQWFTVSQAPIIAASGDPLDLVIAVQAADGELRGPEPAIEYDRRPYRIWREVEDFVDVGTDSEVYVADRTAGVITLAPSLRLTQPDSQLAEETKALAAVPTTEREIRAWYRHGGGTAGNVLPDTLTTLRDPIQGVSVRNPGPATGGRDVETIEHAKMRGPQELRSLNRAVTARDFQLVAERSSGAVARAHACTQRAMWEWATRGTVELVIVPSIPEEIGPHALTVEQLHGLESQRTVHEVLAAVERRRPLGTACEVTWARYKSVRIRAEIVVQREEDAEAVRQRVNERLRLNVGPLPTDESPGGWPFGQSLYASRAYRIILSEPGVRHATNVRLLIDDVPGADVEAIVTDPFHEHTWYVSSGDRVFRSTNGGDGWELVGDFVTGAVKAIEPDQFEPGLLAVATEHEDGTGSTVHVSRDCGENWTFSRPFGFDVEDMAWVVRDGASILLMATGPSGAGGGAGGGLYQLAIAAEADPVQVLVDASDPDKAFYAVASVREVRGEMTVAAAAQGRDGVYLSKEAGVDGTFEMSGLDEEDIRVLAVQRDGPRTYLWAGAAAPGGDQVGRGCYSRELLGADDPHGGWQHRGEGWEAGSCWAIAFDGPVVVAGTQQFGVMRLDASEPDAAWSDPTTDVDNGLPIRDLNRYEPVRAVGVDKPGGRIMAGGQKGVFRSIGENDRPDLKALPKYELCSADEHSEEVTLAPTWLFVCGDNDLTVRSDASS